MPPIIGILIKLLLVLVLTSLGADLSPPYLVDRTV